MPEVERGGRRLKKKKTTFSLFTHTFRKQKGTSTVIFLLLPSHFRRLPGFIKTVLEVCRAYSVALLADLRGEGGSHTALQPDLVGCATAYGCYSIWASRSPAPKDKTRLEPSSSMAWGKNCKRRAARDRAKEEVIALKHQLHWRQYLSWLNRAGFDVLRRHKSAAFTISSSCGCLEVRGIS